MKKIVSLILISIMIIVIATNIYATEGVLGDGNSTTVTEEEYQDAQKENVENNATNNNTSLPQTGIEDYNVTIMLVITVGVALFAYKKILEYRDI